MPLQQAFSPSSKRCKAWGQRPGGTHAGAQRARRAAGSRIALARVLGGELTFPHAEARSSSLELRWLRLPLIFIGGKFGRPKATNEREVISVRGLFFDPWERHSGPPR